MGYTCYIKKVSWRLAMANPLFEKATDLSFLEKLQKTNYALLLLNFGLYLITVLPLIKRLPAVDSPWGDMSAPCSVMFLLAGFGFINILAAWTQPFLASLWCAFVYTLFPVTSKIYNPYEHSFEYMRDPNIVSLGKIESYLASNENAFIKNKYEAREKYYEEGRRLRKTFLKTLFFFMGFINFNSNNIHASAWIWLVYGPLLFLSVKIFPWTLNYLYLAGNKIR
jgi:hypothetical protein